MATKSIARRKTTSYVHNPSGGRALTVGKRRKNAAAKRSTAKKVVARKRVRRNPVPTPVVSRRRRNPRLSNPMDGIGKLLSTALFASAGVVLFDVISNKLLPASFSAPIRIAVKAGAGLAVAQYGKSLPVIGAYSKEIGLVLVTLAGVDALSTYVLPTVYGAFGSMQQPVAAPAELSGWVYVPDEDESEDYESDESDEDY